MGLRQVYLTPLCYPFSYYFGDSLQTAWIQNNILHSLRRSSKVKTRDFPQGFVYEHPTIKSLSQYIFHFIFPEISTSPPRNVPKVEEMLAMARDYSTAFPIHRANPDPLHSGIPAGDVILITGTTGAIGASLLAVLAASPTVTHIFAFNRKGSEPLIQRQKNAFTERDLDVTLLRATRVTLLEGDIFRADLGLPKSDYDQACIIP